MSELLGWGVDADWFNQACSESLHTSCVSDDRRPDGRTVGQRLVLLAQIDSGDGFEQRFVPQQLSILCLRHRVGSAPCGYRTGLAFATPAACGTSVETANIPAKSSKRPAS